MLRVIADSKVKTIEYSAKGIDDSSRNFYIQKLIGNENGSNEVIFECDGTSCAASNGDKLSFSGQVPTQGKIMVDKDGEVYYLEPLVFDDYKCFPISESEFNCINKNEKINYKTNYYIEDLVDLAKEVDEGNDYSDVKIILARNLSFNNDSSYLNSNSTSYGDINKNGIIEGLKTELTIGKGMNPIGGLVGALGDSTIRNSYSHGSVQGVHNVGGLVGRNQGYIKNSYSTATVIGTDIHVGGLVGMIGCSDCNHSKFKIENCYSTGNVTARQEVGGLIGQNGASSENNRTKYTLIRNSFALGNVSGTNGMAGGLVGSNIMNIENTFVKGNVTGTTIGNILGNPENTTYTMNNSYSISTQVLTGTSNITGTTVTPTLLNTASWWRDTLNLGNSFKYEDGYCPLLYKIDEAGNVTNELVEGQVKTPIN